MNGLHFFVFVFFSSALVIGFAVGFDARRSSHRRKVDSSPRVTGTIHLNVKGDGSIGKRIVCFIGKGDSEGRSGKSAVGRGNNEEEEKEEEEEGTGYGSRYAHHGEGYGDYGKAYGEHGAGHNSYYERHMNEHTTDGGESGREDMSAKSPIQGCGRGDDDECNSADGSSVKGGDRSITYYPFQGPVYPD
eukprot:TsM_000990700 transcript=TsM_000990700 gene=TsM_000990700